MNHNPDDLIMLFNDLFRESCRTVLVRGSNEPEYLPASEPDGFARVVFAHGYFASALHEIAHWCIAGEYRRTLHDYGDRKSTRLNSSHVRISYAVFCLKKKKPQ